MDNKAKQTLAPKENSLFKRILKCYEQKQYKNGLKFARQILNNYPDHGETLSMKGLILNGLGRKEEAYVFVRLGLRNNLTSHVCWHVYGLLQKSDKKYEEAIKCYRNALKWDKDHLQILRDLSLLQIQMRDLEGYKETRYRLFDLRPTQRASWIGYAMSFHLLKNYDMALRILEEFRKTIQKTTYDYEYSELLLYQNMVLRESGKYEEALDHLESYKSNICDKVTLNELRGELCIELNKMEDATEVYRNLVNRNPENRDYYLLLAKVLDFKDDSESFEFYEELRDKHPRTHVPRRLQLNYASGEKFEETVDPYLRAALQKGVPPLFVDLRGLYTDPDKVKTIENLMVGYLKKLSSTGYITDKETDCKEPASFLFALMFLSQHYSYLGDTEESLGLLQAALDHTPTLIELYILKGKVLKHAGDHIGACQALNEAQSLDTADRYVNSKAASYSLSDNKIKEAEEMCSKFTREGVSAMENLNEMQCMWFQVECAQAYFRLDDLGNSLKKCHEIDRHFTEIIEDQFDFHTYCMRKMTLRSYIQLLRLEDVLRSNKFYSDAAHIAIKIYLRLYDNPLTDSNNDKIDTSNMTPAEVKKLLAKQRKAKRKAEAEEARNEEKRKEERKAEHFHNKGKGKSTPNDPESTPVEDLIPSKLERPEDPLQEAIHFLEPLKNLASQCIQTHIFTFEIYLRKKKPLIMLQAIKRALRIDPESPELHICIVRFLKFRQENGSECSEPVVSVIEQELKKYLSTLDPTILNEDILNKFQESAPHRLAAAKSMIILDTVQRDRALTIATALDSHLKNVSLNICISVLEWLQSKEFSATKEEIDNYMAKSHKRFPHAVAFNPHGKFDDSYVPQSRVMMEITGSKAPQTNSLHWNLENCDGLSNDIGPVTPPISPKSDSGSVDPIVTMLTNCKVQTIQPENENLEKGIGAKLDKNAVSNSHNHVDSPVS